MSEKMLQKFQEFMFFMLPQDTSKQLFLNCKTPQGDDEIEINAEFRSYFEQPRYCQYKNYDGVVATSCRTK